MLRSGHDGSWDSKDGTKPIKEEEGQNTSQESLAGLSHVGRICEDGTKTTSILDPCAGNAGPRAVLSEEEEGHNAGKKEPRAGLPHVERVCEDGIKTSSMLYPGYV